MFRFGRSPDLFRNHKKCHVVRPEARSGSRSECLLDVGAQGSDCEEHRRFRCRFLGRPILWVPTGQAELDPTGMGPATWT